MSERTPMKLSAGNLLLYLCAIAIIVGGGVYWAHDLEADPPLYVSGLGQSLSTDPAQYVYHARNSVLFGDPDPFDYPRWLVYQKSLTSLVAQLWFSIAGVSFKQANMVGIILSLGALLLFLLAVARHHRPWVIGTVALCYLINITLLVHSRLSYLENGLLLICSVFFLVYSLWGRRTWGIALCGALAAVAMLMGKLFGVLILPALVAAEWYSDGENRIRHIIWALAVFAGAAVIIIVSAYGTNLSAVMGYFSEQSYGLRGFPEGLSSPWGFFEHLIAYGFRNRLFLLDTDLLLCLVGTAFLLTYTGLKRATLADLTPVVRLSIFAVVFIFLGLMPLNYSPIRYTLFLIPPILLAWFGSVDHWTKARLAEPEKSGYARHIALFLVLWHALFQAIKLFFFVNEITIRFMTWTTLPGAVLLTILIRHLINRGSIRLRRSHIYVAAVVTIVFSMGYNAFRISERVLLTTNYTIIESNDDMARIIGPGAVVSGPYAPVLTLDNKLVSFIHLFGVAEVDTTLFERYPITHLAVDSSNWEEAVKNYPQLKDMAPMTAYWIRDYTIKVCNVSQTFGNPEAARYQNTGYERAVDYYSRRMFDSAIVEVGEFLARDPDCRSANLLLCDLLIYFGRYEMAATTMRLLANHHPEDYHANLMCGRAHQILAMAADNNYMMVQAESYYNRAVRNNPFRAAAVRAMYELTKEQFSPLLDSRGSGP